jgi:hypothetical protein
VIVPAGTRPLFALNRRHLRKVRGGMRGLGLLAPTGFTDVETYLAAAAADAGLAVCRTGTYTGCPSPTLYSQVMMAAEQAWFAAHPAPGSPGSVTSTATGLTTPAPAATPARPPAAPASAPASAPVPSRVTQGAQRLGASSSTNQTPPAGGQQVLQSSGVPAPASGATTDITGGSAVSVIPWWGWLLGGGTVLYLMRGGRH